MVDGVTIAPRANRRLGQRGAGIEIVPVKSQKVVAKPVPRHRNKAMTATDPDVQAHAEETIGGQDEFSEAIPAIGEPNDDVEGRDAGDAGEEEEGGDEQGERDTHETSKVSSCVVFSAFSF